MDYIKPLFLALIEINGDSLGIATLDTLMNFARLKRYEEVVDAYYSFATLMNFARLKPVSASDVNKLSFATLMNFARLKQGIIDMALYNSFATLMNFARLKQQGENIENVYGFAKVCFPYLYYFHKQQI